jgi:AAA+ ATPase superfamily predicted ATPase
MIKFKQYYSDNNWIKPDLEKEKAEIDRTADVFKIDSSILYEKLKNAKLVPLNNNLWKKMKNTDSWNINNIEKAEKLSKLYDRNIDEIINGFKNNQSIPAPIVVISKGIPYLVAGNTRLMAARAMKIRPMILVSNL